MRSSNHFALETLLITLSLEVQAFVTLTDLWVVFSGCQICLRVLLDVCLFFFFQAEDGIRDLTVTGVQTCALPICRVAALRGGGGRHDRRPSPLEHGARGAGDREHRVTAVRRDPGHRRHCPYGDEDRKSVV